MSRSEPTLNEFLYAYNGVLLLNMTYDKHQFKPIRHRRNCCAGNENLRFTPSQAVRHDSSKKFNVLP